MVCDSFSEYIMERCDEILSKDERCIEMKKAEAEASREFFNLLPAEYQRAYLKLESVKAMANTQYYVSIYGCGVLDGKSVRKKSGVFLGCL